MTRLFALLFVVFCSANINATPLNSKPNKIAILWLKLSIHSQNAGHGIHMRGVDNESPNSKKFKKHIEAIDSLLDQLVSKGILKKQQFKLKPQLDLEETLITAVGKLIDKAAKEYGYYVVREMMDIGTRQRLKEFDDTAPVILNARMPEPLLKEFQALLKKSKAQK